MKTISPTALEREKLKLDGFFDKGKGKSSDLDDVEDSSDNEFVVKGAKTSLGRKHKRFYIDELKNVIEKQEFLSGELKKVKGQLKELKESVDSNFSNVFGYLKLLMEQLGISNFKFLGSEVWFLYCYFYILYV